MEVNNSIFCRLNPVVKDLSKESWLVGFGESAGLGGLFVFNFFRAIIGDAALKLFY